MKTHPVRAARIAIMHTWLSTQAEGWWRLEFDRLEDSLRLHQHADRWRRHADLRSKYDVIVFGPGGGAAIRRAIVSGMPMYGNPLPWKVTPQTPNLAQDR